MRAGARAGGRIRKVADLMHREVVSIRPEASVRELARRLRDHRVAGMPVVDETGTAVGTVSVTDLLWLLDRVDIGEGPGPGSVPGEDLEARTVRDVTTPDVFGVAPRPPSRSSWSSSHAPGSTGRWCWRSAVWWESCRARTSWA